MVNPNSSPSPSLVMSLIPLAVLVVFLALTISLLGGNAIAGGSQFSLLATTAVCAAIAIGRYKCSWKSIEDAVIVNMRSATPAIVILLLIGAIAGTWMASGI